MRRGSRASSTGRSGAARAGAVSNDRGTVARVQTAGGAEVVAADNGDRSAAAVRAPGGDWYAGGGNGDWYAGGDGNLYRRDQPTAGSAPTPRASMPASPVESERTATSRRTTFPARRSGAASMRSTPPASGR